MDPETRFRAVFDLAYAPLCRYARHRGLTGPDAEDLVAQTLEVAWRRIGDVPAAEPLPWVYAVAHNLWRNQARRDRRRRELLARLRASPSAAAREDPAGLGPGVLRRSRRGPRPQRELEQLRVALARPYGHEGDPVFLARPAHACSSDVFPLPAGAEAIVTASRPRDPTWRPGRDGRSALARPRLPRDQPMADMSAIAPSPPGTRSG